MHISIKMNMCQCGFQNEWWESCGKNSHAQCEISTNFARHEFPSTLDHLCLPCHYLYSSQLIFSLQTLHDGLPTLFPQPWKETKGSGYSPTNHGWKCRILSKYALGMRLCFPFPFPVYCMYKCPSLQLFLELSLAQPTQIGILFTFLARQLARRENSIIVNRTLFEQVNAWRLNAHCKTHLIHVSPSYIPPSLLLSGPRVSVLYN